MTANLKQQNKNERTYDGVEYAHSREYNLKDTLEKADHDAKRKQLEDWLDDADQIWEDSSSRKHFETGPFEVEYAIERMGTRVRIYWSIEIVDDAEVQESDDDE